MNPPSALYGAMNKERKPFTYTPGGLDLSEIKSERMAQRLMRNAMSEGVSEMPVRSIQSPPVQLNSNAIPNYNCLPVQVFPTFPLPANPKSLLRTRSNPDPTKEPLSSIVPAQSLNISDKKCNTDRWKDTNKPSSFLSNDNNNINNNKTINDYKSVMNNSATSKLTNYGSDGFTEIILPEKCYDAEYFVLEPQGHVKLLEDKTSKIDIDPSIKQISDTNTFVEIATEKSPVALTSLSAQDRTTNDLEQKEVKIIKKQSKSGKEADQNGDTEAAVVVKLPTKKSSAKTETKVEVLKKVLPDGSIEETKTTITKTTIDGKTEIKTKTETTILPKEETEIEIEETEEETEDVIEENGSEENEDRIEESVKVLKSKKTFENISKEEETSVASEVKENGHIVGGEEKVEISTTKNVVVSQSSEQESEEEKEDEKEEEEEEEIEEVEEKDDSDIEVKQTIVLKKQDEQIDSNLNDEDSDQKLEKNIKEDETEEVEEEEMLEEEIIEDEQIKKSEEIKKEVNEAEGSEVEEDEEIDEERENAKEQLLIKEIDKTVDKKGKEDKGDDAEKEVAEEVETKVDLSEKIVKDLEGQSTESSLKEEKEQLQNSSEPRDKEDAVEKSPTEISASIEDKNKERIKDEHIHKISFQPESKVSFREPSIPLEKVEDVEIKPIGPAQEIIKKSHTEIITTTKDEPTGALSTQTEYNRIENIVTVNRTTKTLDHAYEQAEPTIPTVKTYFAPHNDRILTTPQPVSRPYQPVYTPEPQTERRHSLLLDRLSIERQIPAQHTDTYQNNYLYNNQNYEQGQWLQGPQSEVLTVSNVKPSTITKNQQWYQQSKREENVTSNIVAPTPIMPSQLSQPHSQTQQQTQSQYQSFVQPQYTPKPEFQPTYKDNTTQNSFNTSSTNFQQNIYPSYTPKPSWVSSTFESKPPPVAQPTQYSSLKQESKDSYQKSSQQFSSSYVPPPWEQDPSYVPENQNFYQPPPSTTVYTPGINQTWKPKQPTGKFTKPAPTAYIPPAPNQSFVKTVTNIEPMHMPGRKTYYSEYERRYISVPESTYIPTETKFQAQPDPSPQYYYDNNEPSETVEPQWRKELREFTEKTSQTTTSQTEKISVRPPWEDDPKYAAPQYTSTPTWTQTLRPRSWRETSFETEYIGSEWPKTNTLGRGRPQNSYLKSNVDTIQERPRGVSVDRYNPNSYQSPLPSEQSPVQSHTLNPNIHPKAYHNPNVPAYHARTSAEPREHTTTAPYTQRTWGEARAPPVQSRSFKYLQWITGTED